VNCVHKKKAAMTTNALLDDISLERLPPASSVPPLPDRASKKDAENKSRRRRSHDDETASDTPSASSDEPEHQIDNLAWAMMPSSTSPPASSGSEQPLSTLGEEQLLQAGMALLSQLEESLLRAQKALVAVDGAAVEQFTGEQARLSRAFAICFPPQIAPAKREADGTFPLTGWTQLQVAARRVAQLARVHEILLRRARSVRNMLTNFSADPGEIYSSQLFAGQDAGAGSDSPKEAS
jgi:hypothetical protein